MVRRIGWRKFLEWQAYEELEPFADERADHNAAHIVQFLWAMSGDKRYPNGRPLSDFLLKFGDANVVQHTAEPQNLELLIDTWIAGSNLAFGAKEATQ